MTLSPAQYKKLYDGLPSVLGGVSVGKTRTYQYTNRSVFPRLYFSVMTEGLAQGDPYVLANYLNEAETLRTNVWAQRNKARLRVIIDSQDPKQLRQLAYQLVTELKNTELRINPIQDMMQFRGADPPLILHPVTPPDGKLLVQRYAVDFWVEYLQTWTKVFDVIKEVHVEFEATRNETSSSETFYAAYESSSNEAEFYSLDAIFA